MEKDVIHVVNYNARDTAARYVARQERRKGHQAAT